MQSIVQPPVQKHSLFATNQAGWERLLRIVLGLALLWLGWTGAVSGSLGVVFKWLGFVPLATGLVGWCPLYTALGFSTKPRA
jgi:Inner membrane protein YgaP-like, transmembrane domain